jgi:hypothetical protein
MQRGWRTSVLPDLHGHACTVRRRMTSMRDLSRRPKAPLWFSRPYAKQWRPGATKGVGAGSNSEPSRLFSRYLFTCAHWGPFYHLYSEELARLASERNQDAGT